MPVPLPDPPEVGLDEVLGVDVVSDEEAEQRAAYYERLRAVSVYAILI